jgi:hypothetical protein
VNEAEQEVLGADVVTAQTPAPLLSQDDHRAGALGKPLKHTQGSHLHDR